MPLITADRVKDTTNTTGTGSLALSGTAPTGYRTFASVMSTSDTCYYCVATAGGAEWEVGLGTLTASTTLARTTVLASSNAGAAVNLSAGTKSVFITVPAESAKRLATGRDRRWFRGSAAHAADDEFNDDTITGWTQVDTSGASGRVTWAEGGDSLSCLLAGGDTAHIHAQMKALTLSTGDSISCFISGKTKSLANPMAGLIMADGVTGGSGTQSVNYVFVFALVTTGYSTAAWSGYTTRSAFTDLSSSDWSAGVHLKMVYSAADTFDTYVSDNGVAWYLLGSRTISLTPTYVGVWGSSFNAAGSGTIMFSFDYFRVNV